MHEMSQARMEHGLLLPLPKPLHLPWEAAQQAPGHPMLEPSLLGVATGRRRRCGSLSPLSR
jgi:hypothetical protein